MAAAIVKRAKAPGPPAAASGELGLEALIGNIISQFTSPRCVYVLESSQAAHCCGSSDDGTIGVFETADLARAAARRHLREVAEFCFDEWNYNSDGDDDDDDERNAERQGERTAKLALALAAGKTDIPEIHRAIDAELEDADVAEFDSRREAAEESYFLGVLGVEDNFEGGAFSETWKEDGTGRIIAPEGASTDPGPCALTLRVRKFELVTRTPREGEGGEA